MTPEEMLGKARAFEPTHDTWITLERNGTWTLFARGALVRRDVPTLEEAWAAAEAATIPVDRTQAGPLPSARPSVRRGVAAPTAGPMPVPLTLLDERETENRKRELLARLDAARAAEKAPESAGRTT